MLNLFRKKGVVAMAAMGAVVVVLTGCGPGGAAQDASGPSDESLKIGAIYLDTQGFYAGVKHGMVTAAEKSSKDVEFIETNSQGDVSNESQFVDTLISSGADAIVLSAASADASVAALRRASEAGMPVVCYNTCVNEADAKEYVYQHVRGESFEFGHKTGVAAAEYLKKEGVLAPKIGVVNCEFVEQCVLRREGFEKALSEAGIDYEIVANQQGTEATEALGVAESMLTANPEIDVLYGESGGATEGAVKAVENKGLTGEVVVFGSDITSELARALEDYSILKALVNVSGTATGKAAFESAVNAIEGEEPEDFYVPIPFDVYTTSEQGTEWLESHPKGIP